MEALSKLLNPLLGSTTGVFHLNSNSHRNGSCPCKLETGSTSIWTAAETNDYDTVYTKVTQNNSLVSKFDAYGYTALHYAAQQNHIKIVEFLLSKCSNPDINQCGATPLHRASYAGSLESCELLLKKGADVNAVDSSYKDLGTPLHKAYSVANVEIVQLLLKYKANFLLTDAAGKIPQQLLKKKYLFKFPELGGNIVSSQNTKLNNSTDDSTGNFHDKNNNKDNDKNNNNLASDTTTTILPSAAISSISEHDSSTVGSSNNTRSKTGNIGLKCSRCNLTSISFTRLKDGLLLCIDCKYKAV